MERSEDLWLKAHNEARTWLRRYQDVWTKNHRDDIVQETSLAAWQWASGARHGERLWAAVQTIARRIRGRGVRAPHVVWTSQSVVASATRDDAPPRESYYLIGGRREPDSKVRPCLRDALQRLPPIDRELLLGFHEGFCCAELAERFRRSLACVKTRIHRARRRVRKSIEMCVRTANGFDD